MGKFRVGIDIGGTFTDLVALEESTGELTNLKVPSTTERLVDGVADAFRRFVALVDHGEIDMIMHATTIATNAILGQVGFQLPKTALITTRGFRDVLEIGRQNRPELYNLFVKRPRPLILRRYRYEVEEGVDSAGRETTPLNLEAVTKTAAQLKKERIESVAIALINSYANPNHEQKIKKVLERIVPGLSITVSCEVAPEYREYERMSTSAVNAVLMPIVGRYIQELGRDVEDVSGSPSLYMMKSSGGVVSPETAASTPVAMIESGPTAGVVASAFYSQLLGIPTVLSFDMGGTTAKAGLVEDGSPRIVSEYEVGGKAHRGRVTKGSGYPVRLPFVDLAECSAGGGTVAWVDRGGAVRVGPLSTGAYPGPACYGLGGEEPTITDANLLLGRLSPQYLLGGRMAIQKGLARDAVKERICRRTGLSVAKAALGITRIVNSQMSKILRMVSVERGYDPRMVTLIAFGGAGPLHACALAEELGIPSVVVPPNPGLFSAYGLLAADFKDDFLRAVMKSVLEVDSVIIEETFKGLEERGKKFLRKEKVGQTGMTLLSQLDVRYSGQAYELTIPVTRPFTASSVRKLVSDFHKRHEAVYGYAAEEEVIEVVNARLTAIGAMRKPELKERPVSGGKPSKESAITARECLFEKSVKPVDTPVYRRGRLRCGDLLQGPAVVEQYDATTLVYPGWVARVDGFGNICLTRGRR